MTDMDIREFKCIYLTDGLNEVTWYEERIDKEDEVFINVRHLQNMLENSISMNVKSLLIEYLSDIDCNLGCEEFFL